jgi:hypothetical protein
MDINAEEKTLQQQGICKKEPCPQQEKASLKDEMRNVIGKARMVLPGMQALFGFQTMAVFSHRFENIADSRKLACLAALGLLVLAMGLLMSLAACKRLAE